MRVRRTLWRDDDEGEVIVVFEIVGDAVLLQLLQIAAGFTTTMQVENHRVDGIVIVTGREIDEIIELSRPGDLPLKVPGDLGHDHSACKNRERSLIVPL